MGGLLGGSSPTVQTIAATPAPAPANTEAALTPFVDEDLEKKKRESKTQGTKSLQIPLGTIGGASTIGTA